MLGWLRKPKDVNRLIARGQLAKAVEELETRLRRKPKSVHLRQLLADVLVRDGQQGRAVGILEGLAEEYAADGFAAKAIAMVKKIQRVDPARPGAEEMLASLVGTKTGSDRRPPEGVAGPRPEPAPPLAEAPPEWVPPWAPERAAPGSRPVEGLAAYKTSKVVLAEDWFEEAAEGRDDFNWSPIFNDFSKSELAALVGGLRLLVKKPGSIIFTEGEDGESLFILANGYARVYKQDRSGHNSQAALLKEGEIFGVPSVLSGEPRAVTIVAITECELLELDQENFENISETFPRIRELVEELRDTRPF